MHFLIKICWLNYQITVKVQLKLYFQEFKLRLESLFRSFTTIMGSGSDLVCTLKPKNRAAFWNFDLIVLDENIREKRPIVRLYFQLLIHICYWRKMCIRSSKDNCKSGWIKADSLNLPKCLLSFARIAIQIWLKLFRTVIKEI